MPKHGLTQTLKLGTTPAPGVAGRALAASTLGRRPDGGVWNISTPPEFSARARKTTPEAGALPMLLRSSGLILAVAALVVCALAPRLPGAASTSVPPGAPFAIDVWETDDGLPQNSVIALTQTRDGYLWLGTLNGLVRFDGLRFTVFDESNTPGLNSSRIVSLFEDSRGDLWIGTETAGIVRVHDGQVTSLGIGRGSREGRLAAACEDALGAVWLYTADGQLWRWLNGATNFFQAVPSRPSACRALIAETNGTVWLGTDQSLLALHPAGKLQPPALPVAQEIPVGKLDFLLASRSGGHWRLADGRVQKWTTNHLDRDLGPYPWRGVSISSACEDPQGNLLVGTLGQGLFLFDPAGQASSLSTNAGLSHDYVLSLLVDREGTLWVGTDGGGLDRVKRQFFNVLPESGGWAVQSVCEDNQGGLWIGANGSGASLLREGQLRRFGPAQGLANPFVRSIFIDRDQRVWAGTYGAGLFRFENDRFQRVSAIALSPFIQAIHQDRAGTLWVGTDAGLARWDGRNWKLLNTRDGLSADTVRAIADDREGNLWIGTVGGGLNCLRDGRFTAFRKTPNGLPSDNISSLYLDDEGVLWIGTDGGGLARFHQGRWTRFTTRDGLVSSVGYLIEDGEGYFWIGSNAGLMRVKKKALNDFARGDTGPIPCRAYGKADGLPTRECTLGSQPGAARTRDGTLWFPTIKGLASVNPSRLRLNTNPPPVHIERVLVEGEPPIPTGLRAGLPAIVTVPAGREWVEISFTSLNLAAPETARFKYRLEGHETAWTEAGNIRVAHYSKLPPGRYTFRVSACNEDGIWNDTGCALVFMVEPPFWRTWWFLTAATVALLGAIVAVVHYFSTQKLQRQLETLRQHEALEKERARIARDIHDQLGASLTQVSLLGELVESDKDFPDEVAGHARQISQTARDTSRALDEIVWTVNPSNDTLEGLVNYVCKYAQEYLAVAGLRYRLEVPPELPAATITPELRHNVFLAAKEAVTNVVRHAKATSVWVRLELSPSAFTLEIQDNGRGPAGLDEKKGRNGLRNMRKRMEDVGGSFSLAPGPEGGTVVRLTAPLR